MSTHLERELREQPEALARLLEHAARRARSGSRALFRRDDVSYILIASRGSSSNAARYAQYLLGRAHRVPVAFATPSLYTLYEQPPRLDGALVIGISQSGESPDVKEVLEEARRQGRPTVAITNDVASPLAGVADAVLPLEAGEELAVAATKTYVNSLGAIALLFAVVDRRRRGARRARAHARARSRCSSSARGTTRSGSTGSASCDGGTVVARGINYATAFEIALKIRELSGLLFEAYSAADLMHGPVAAVAPGWPVVAVAPSRPGARGDGDRDRCARGARRAADRRLRRRSRCSRAARSPAAACSGRACPSGSARSSRSCPGQLAALRLAQLRGIDLDSAARPAEGHADALSVPCRA